MLKTACRIGFRSARERGRAVVALWGLAVLAIAAYYLVPGVASALEPVGSWQQANGWRASFVLCAVFCGLVPYVVYLIRRESGGRSPLVTAAAQAVWCGLCGIVCGWFFTLQGRWFGCGHDLTTVLKKVVVDQFGWSVLVIVPGTAVFYAVLSGGWRVKDERVPFGTFVREAYLPTLVMNLIVRQQWPWNGKVTVDFVLFDPNGDPHDLAVVLRNGETVLDVPAAALTGDLEDVLPGARRIVWDPTGVSDKPLESLTATVSVADDPKKFMILDLSGGSAVEQVPVSFASHPPKAGWAADSANYTTKLVLRRIDAGTYTVGSPETEGNRVALHEPLRQVTLSKSYYLALFPTTNKQYEQIAGARPSGSITGDDAPVYMVSLAMLRGENAHLTPADGGTWPKSGEGSFFANFNVRVSLGEGLAGYQFDVPSGAQWEIACRAGTTTAWYNGLENDPSLPGFTTRLAEIARYSGNRSSAVPTVTARQPNPWGFYDFIGNTREWVRDFFSVDGPIDAWYNSVSAVDGVVWRNNSTVACSYTRGGYEWCAAHEVRTARWTYAGYYTPTATGHDDRELGFRIACTYFGE